MKIGNTKLGIVMKDEKKDSDPNKIHNAVAALAVYPPKRKYITDMNCFKGGFSVAPICFREQSRGWQAGLITGSYGANQYGLVNLGGKKTIGIINIEGDNKFGFINIGDNLSYHKILNKRRYYDSLDNCERPDKNTYKIKKGLDIGIITNVYFGSVASYKATSIAPLIIDGKVDDKTLRIGALTIRDSVDHSWKKEGADIRIGLIHLLNNEGKEYNEDTKKSKEETNTDLPTYCIGTTVVIEDSKYLNFDKHISIYPLMYSDGIEKIIKKFNKSYDPLGYAISKTCDYVKNFLKELKEIKKTQPT